MQNRASRQWLFRAIRQKIPVGRPQRPFSQAFAPVRFAETGRFSTAHLCAFVHVFARFCDAKTRIRCLRRSDVVILPPVEVQFVMVKCILYRGQIRRTHHVFSPFWPVFDPKTVIFEHQIGFYPESNRKSPWSRDAPMVANKRRINRP